MDRFIENAWGERLACTWTAGPHDASPVVVIGHGLTSDRERPWSQALSSALALRGMASLRPAFSGNGDSAGRFEDSTITKEVSELGSLIDALGAPRVAYVGHSMGAAVGLLRAVEDERIAALVSLAGMVHTREFGERMLGGLADGALILDKPGKPMGPALREDLRRHESLAWLAPRVRVPWLFVHGDADDVVPIANARDAHVGAGRADLVELEGVDHSFTGPACDVVARLVADWLELRFASA